MSDQQQQAVETDSTDDGLSFESEARTMGWVPQEEFRGDPERHIPAQEFVERGRDSIPLLRANQKKLTKQVGDLQEAISYQNTFHAGEQKRLKDGFKADMRAAVQEGDTEAYDVAEKGHASVPDAPQAVVSTGPSDSEVTFAETYKWYGTDDSKTGAVLEESARLRRDVPNLTEAQHFASLDRFIDKEFDTEGAPPLKPGSRVAKPRRGGTPPGGKSFNDLPDDAKQAFDGFVKMKVFADNDEDRKRYVTNYKWD